MYFDAEVERADVPADALLVDIREPYEWEAGRIPGSRHIPMDLLPEVANGLPTDRPLVIVCLGGVRAAFCAAALAAVHPDVKVLRGGLRSWVAGGGEFEGGLAPHGQPPKAAEPPKATDQAGVSST